MNTFLVIIASTAIVYSVMATIAIKRIQRMVKCRFDVDIKIFGIKK